MRARAWRRGSPGDRWRDTCGLSLAGNWHRLSRAIAPAPDERPHSASTPARPRLRRATSRPPGRPTPRHLPLPRHGARCRQRSVRGHLPGLFLPAPPMVTTFVRDAVSRFPSVGPALLSRVYTPRARSCPATTGPSRVSAGLLHCLGSLRQPRRRSRATLRGLPPSAQASATDVPRGSAWAS